MDDCLALEHLLHTVCRNGSSREHDREHAQHQESHDDLHRILDERHHIADLHLSLINAVSSGPHDQDGHPVHDKHHDRHHKCHGTVDEQVRLCQIDIRSIEPLFLMSLRTEGTNNRESCQNLAHNKVHLVDQCLQNLEFRHRHKEQHEDDQCDQNDRQRDDP